MKRKELSGAPGRFVALRTSLVYAAISTLWILFSDTVMFMFIRESEGVAYIGMLKGVAFVLVTSAVIYVLIERGIRHTRMSENKYRTLYNNINDMVFANEVAADGTPGQFVDVNDAACKRLGYARSELLTMSRIAIEAPGHADRLTETSRSARHSGTVTFDTILVSRTGEHIPVEINAHLSGGEGMMTSLSVARDVSGRKQAEAALRRSEERFVKAFRSSPDAIIISSVADGRFLEVNAGFTRLSGYTPEEVLGRSSLTLNMWEDPAVREQYASAIRNTGRVTNMEFRYRTKSGTVRDGLVSGECIELDGEPCILGIIRDITDRKQADSERERLLHALNNRVKELTVLHRVARLLQSAQESDSALLTDIVAVLPSGWQFDEETEACIIYDDVRVATPGWRETKWKLDASFSTSDGRKGAIAVVYLSEKPLADEGPFLKEGRTLINSLSEMIGSYFERKRAEAALRAREGELRALFMSMKDVVLVLDSNGRYLKIAPSRPELLYRPPADLIGKTLEEVMPDRAREFHSHIERTLATGKTSSVEYSLTIGGSVVWFAATVSPMTPTTVLWVARDITDRVKSEVTLKRTADQLHALTAHLQRVREDERTAIAREIHDELGQSLTGIKMDVSWLLARLGQDQPKVRERGIALQQLVDGTVKAVQKLSTELRPGMLDELGLSAAVEWQVNEFQERSGIACSLAALHEIKDISRDSATAVFRIFQETLTNVARHSHATRVTVELREEGPDIVLRVNDNGKGITSDEIADQSSIGLLGMSERARAVAGEFSISGSPDGGTTVVVRVPRVQMPTVVEGMSR